MLLLIKNSGGSKTEFGKLVLVLNKLADLHDLVQQKTKKLYTQKQKSCCFTVIDNSIDLNEKNDPVYCVVNRLQKQAM